MEEIYDGGDGGGGTGAMREPETTPDEYGYSDDNLNVLLIQ